MIRFLESVLVFAMLAVPAVAADWPTWRFDASRSAVSPEKLPEHLSLAWHRDLGANHVAWQEDPRLQFDASYEPIVIGNIMVVASSRTDSVTALDTRSGQVLWKFFAGGPVRLAPVAWQGSVYFGADDGEFYCLELASGRLHWKFEVAPMPRRVLGNERLISVFPVRGGAVVHDGKLYFTAGVWPFEGTLLYTVDLQRSHAGVPRYTTTQLDDVSPQGHLVVNDNRLYIPAGRAKATCINLSTGATVKLNYDSRGLTDYHVTSSGPLLFHGASVYDLGVERQLPLSTRRPLFDGRWIMGPTVEQPGEQMHLSAFDLSKRTTVKAKDRRGNDVLRDQVPLAWQVAADDLAPSDQPIELRLMAGHRLYGNRGNVLFSIKTQAGSDGGRGAWQTTIEGRPSSMLAADGRLFVVTYEGRIHCFSGDAQSTQMHPLDEHDLADDQSDPNVRTRANALVQRADDPAGYCLVLGIGSGDLILEMARGSDLQIIAVDRDSASVEMLRRRTDAAGVYGRQIVALTGELPELRLPPYLASLIVRNDGAAAELPGSELEHIFERLRPYGGAAVFSLEEDDFARFESAVKKRNVPGAKLVYDRGHAVLSRPGALPGSADWTHEYGDAANTLMSQDQLVKAPFGVLWFGGPAGNGELFDRHYWGPGLTVVDGRMFVQGPKRLAAIDIYTGRVLWKKTLRDGSGPGRRGNFFDVEKPGFHFAAVRDSVYLVYPDVCLRLDPRTGETLAELRLPTEKEQWGKVRVWQDLLIATVFGEDTSVGPRAVQAVNRYRGHLVWRKDGTDSIPLVSVGGDTVFYFDGVLEGFYDAWKRRGLVPKSPSPAKYLYALDARTGRGRWARSARRTATWLAYSREHDSLVVSNKKGVDVFRGSDGHLQWTKDEEAPGFGGHPENVWDKVIVSGDLVIDQRGPGQAYSLHTGEPASDVHPVTGEPVAWQFTKTGHHCNYAIASPNLLTFRAGTAGFFDRNTGGTSRLLGFRSGCRNSLIPAGGVLNAPNYAHGCICSYNLFTSLAFVHLPEADLWTYNAYRSPTSAAQRFGINFGAPGDRRAASGTLWLEFPPTADPSPGISVNVEGDLAKPFRLHTAQVAADHHEWVAASGLEGMSALRILLPGEATPRRYRVRLLFAEPAAIDAGERVFDVALQGKTVLGKFDIVHEAGGARRLVERQWDGVQASSDLRLTFSAHHGQPLICGLEVIAETKN